MALLLAGARLLRPTTVVERSWVLVAGGRILAVGSGEPPPADERVDLSGLVLAPGFVDLHVHGGGGASFETGDPHAVEAAVHHHASRGTTTLLASLVTRPMAELESTLALLRDRVGEGTLAGVHLEGPFLAAARCGAHEPSLLRDPVAADVERLLRAGAGSVAMVTLAPERPGGIEAVRRVVGHGALAAVGHTDADHATTVAAIGAGARVATHLFNAMPPLHHRAPGPVAALLDDDRILLELVGDGHHLHPAVVRMVLHRAGASRVAWVSDATAAAGLPDGDHDLAGLPVTVRSGVATLTGSPGTLAGSTSTVADAVRRAVTAGVDVRDAVTAATLTPARALGIADEIGAVEAGRRADLVVLDEDLAVRRVMRGGHWLVEPGG